MGTTSDKLTYLNETKTLLKNKINLTGANITTDTFRQYPTKLQNALLDVWNNEGEPIFTNWSNKINGEGTNVNLDNTINARMKLTPKGNTSQIQYSGKNLLNNILTTQTLNGITATRNVDGSITLNGTATAQTDFTFLNTRLDLENGTYTFSISNVGNSNVQLQYGITGIGIMDTGTATKSYTTTFPNSSMGTTYSYVNMFRVRILSGAVLNNYTIYPMIEKNNQATTYEPYVGGTPSPNPDYPQNVNVVSGDNEVDIVGKNLFEQEYILSPNDNNKNAHLKAGTYTLATCDSNNFGTNVYFKLFNSSGSAITTSGHLTSTNVEINFSTSSYNYYGGGGSSHITFTIDNDYTIAIGLLNADGTRQVMLTKGTTPVRTYEPYKSQNYPLYLGVENLFNKDNANILNAFFSDVSILTSNANTKTLYITCKPNTTYTISKIASTRFRVMTTNTTPELGITGSGYKGPDGSTKITLTTDANANYLCVFYYNGNSDTKTEEEIRNSIQIEYGSNINHVSSTPIQLCNIGNYVDFPFKAVNGDKYYDTLTQAQKDLLTYGKWYLHKEVGKVVLNGSESWSYEGGRFVVNFLINALNTSGRQQALSNYFNYVASGSASYGIFIYKASDTNYQIYIYDSDYTTANDFKTWLGTHNTNVYYVLNTPTDTEITNSSLINQLEDLRGAMSYEGQTNISSGFMIVGASALGELN